MGAVLQTFGRTPKKERAISFAANRQTIAAAKTQIKVNITKQNQAIGGKNGAKKIAAASQYSDFFNSLSIEAL